MVRRYVRAALAAIGIGLLGATIGCGGNGLIYPGVVILTVNGTSISPAAGDVTSGGTLQISNTGTTAASVTYSSTFTAATIPALSTLSMTCPIVGAQTDITVTVVGGTASVVHIHP